MTAQFSSRALQRLLLVMCSAIRLPGVRMRGHRHAPLRFLSWTSALTVLVASALLSACASAPVQEMSNARQTIRAAQDAGAARYAPAALSEAQALLSQAETALHRHEYRNARRHAIEAHEKAAQALHAAEEHR